MARQEGDDADEAILVALLDRKDDGMTIFELRNQVHIDIDTIETSLERLKTRGLIETEYTDSRVTIRPTDAATDVVDVKSSDESFIDRMRERLPF